MTTREPRVVPPHQRRGAEPSTPSTRIIELTQIVELQRQELVEAGAEIHRLQALLREHGLDESIRE